MERIKKALEMARQERAGAQPADTVARAGEAKGIPSLEKGVEYTQTRIVPLSPVTLKRSRVIAGDGRDSVTDAYRILRTQVLQRLKENGWNSLAVTSSGAGEGKSLTAINLAISLAREVNHTVLLVDMDLRRPSIAGTLGITPEHGLSDYLLSDDLDLQEIMFNPSIERLVVVPGKGSLQHSSEILSSPKALRFIEEIKTRYPSRIVIFDLPPVLVSDDALAFSPNVDAFLMVVEEGKATSDDLKRSLEMLSDVNIVGTVLNKAESATKAAY